MMTLAEASSYFDRTQVLDAVTSLPLFMAQVDPFEDSHRDAYSAYRRTMSVAPGTVIPDHRTVHLLGSDWIVGEGESDGMQELHRQKYVISPAPASLKVSTLAQYLEGTFTKTVLAAPYWTKDAKQAGLSSEQPQMYDVFVPSAVPPQVIIWDELAAYLTVSVRPMPSGFTSAFSLKLDRAVETVAITTRRYDPVAGDYTVMASPTSSALRVRWQSLFEYDSQMEARYQDGDLSVVLPDLPAVDTSALIEFPDTVYQVLSVDRIGGAQVAHCRRTTP